MKECIDKELDPAKVDFYDQTKEEFVKTKSITEILQELEISKVDYENGLPASSDDYELHLEKPSDSCFVKNHFESSTLAWEVNIDIQPVINHYKAVSYMCAYLSKIKDECSNAMSQAVNKGWENKSNNYDQMKLIARAYASKRECSVQEAMYHIMQELWLRKVFPLVLFANTNLLENRYRVCVCEKEIKQLPESSTDIFKKNMLDR